MGGRRRESSGLIAVGLVASLPTASAGLADYSDGHEEQQRVGLVHAGLNMAAVACYAGALLRRRRGRAGDRLLSVAGGTVGGVAALLGGHLSYRQASGANHGEEVQHVGPGDWRAVDRLTELPTGRPVRRIVGDVPVFVLRHGGVDGGGGGGVEGVEGAGAPSGERVTVLSDRCPHLSAPLHEGELGSVDSELCVTCPWHASVFRVSDGAVVHGPATAAVPGFETRLRDGVLEARVRTLPGISAS
jgi:nitrite reductase/ring-hydroxylating ferredoxin subunit